jgi:hypothetical protein
MEIKYEIMTNDGNYEKFEKNWNELYECLA